MLNRNIKHKLRKGVTLVELVIAVTVLVVAVSGILTAFNVGFMTSTRAHNITMASIEAQLQMEMLLGRRWDGGTLPLASANFSTPPAPLATWNQSFESNGFFVRLEHEALEALGGHSRSNMAGITASVTEICALGCLTNCPPEELMLIQVTVFIYMTLDDAESNPNTSWVVRHRNVLNVNGRIV